MSVTMHLYKILPDVKYNGYYLDFVTQADMKMGEDGYYPLEKKEKELGAPLTEDGHWPDAICGDELYTAYQDWEDKQKASAWSDGLEHDKLDMTYIKGCFGRDKGWHRIAKRLNGFDCKTFSTPGYTYKYLTVDEIEYAQGWFFKKKFFNKKTTVVLCTTKEQMENFFKTYIDFNDKHDTRGREAVERFLAAWQDGMIFECAW